MNSNLVGGFTIAVLALALILGGFGAGTALSGNGGANVTTTTTATTTKTVANSSSPYVITLVIATDSIFNSTASDQPAFFFMGPNGLQSAGTISLPVNRTIELVIVNYDDGAADLVQSGVNSVSGTIGGSMFVASNDNINSTQGSSGIVIRGGETVTSIPAGNVSHTFSAPSLHLNIPVPVSSTVIAYFTVTKAGTYLWFCLTACGDAAMSTTGWMTGSLAAAS
jgi:hypothetical protein